MSNAVGCIRSWKTASPRKRARAQNLHPPSPRTLRTRLLWEAGVLEGRCHTSTNRSAFGEPFGKGRHAETPSPGHPYFHGPSHFAGGVSPTRIETGGAGTSSTRHRTSSSDPTAELCRRSVRWTRNVSGTSPLVMPDRDLLDDREQRHARHPFFHPFFPFRFEVGTIDNRPGPSSSAIFGQALLYKNMWKITGRRERLFSLYCTLAVGDDSIPGNLQLPRAT